MDSIKEIINTLASNKAVFEQLFQTPNNALRHWKPSPTKWSFQEILCHMLDEEIYDFRARSQYSLEDSDVALPPIDPQGWVQSRKYSEKNYDKTLSDFLHERMQSIKWLESLDNPNWESTSIHPRIGRVSARFFLTNWIAHDYLHIQQIMRYRLAFFKEQTDITLNYAGS